MRVRRPVDLDQDQTYREIGIRSHCKGIFHKPPTSAEQIGEKRVFWIEPGCLVLNIVFAWEQAVAMTSEREAGMIASHRFPMYQSRNGTLLPEFAWRYFSSPRGKYDLEIASPGGAGRNKTLGQREFDQLKIPVPPLSHQRMVIDSLRTIDLAIQRTIDLITAKQLIKAGLAQRLLSGDRRFGGSNNEWPRAAISGMCLITKGTGISKSDVKPEGLPAIRYGELYSTYGVRIDRTKSFINADSAMQSKKIKKGDIVLAGSGESIDEIGRAAAYMGNENAYAGGDTIVLSPRKIDSLFLAYVLNGSEIRRELRRLGQGQTVVHIYMRDIASLELPLPPRPEQGRIARILGAADREIDLLGEKVRSLRRLKQGLMQKVMVSPALEKSA